MTSNRSIETRSHPAPSQGTRNSAGGFLQAGKVLARPVGRSGPRPVNRVFDATMDPSAAQYMLMYFVLPVWLAAGFADYLCHRAASIATTSGPKESLLHLLQFGEMAVPTLAAIFLEINSLVIAVMIVCLVAHEATAIWDVSYAYRTREIRS